MTGSESRGSDASKAACAPRIKDVPNLRLMEGLIQGLQPCVAQSRHSKPCSWVVDGLGWCKHLSNPPFSQPQAERQPRTQGSSEQKYYRKLSLFSHYPTTDHTASPLSSQRLRIRHELVEHAECRQTNPISTCQYLYLRASY